MQEIIWSVCQDYNCPQLQGFVKSLRDNGYDGRILVWSEFEINGAETKPLDPSIILDPAGMWKFDYLKKMAAIEQDAIFAYFSPFHYVVKSLPGSFSELIKDNDIFCFLESNIISNFSVRKTWMNINNFNIYDMARSYGMVKDGFYNLNANHFIIKSSYIENFIKLRNEMPDFLRKRSANINDELVLSMIVNAVCKDVDGLLLKNNENWYGIDWKGFFKSKLPNSMIWDSEDYFTGKVRGISPAIVMCPNSSDALTNFGKNLVGKRIVEEKDKPLNKGCGSCQRNKPQTQVIPANKG